MNILINYLSAVSGGALSYLRNITPLLAHRIQQDGHKLFILVGPTQFSDLEGLDIACVSVIETSKNTLGRLYWERTQLPRFLEKHAIDVLFTPYQWVPYVNGVKNVSMIRNMEPFLHGKYKYSLKNRLRNIFLGRFSGNSLIRSDSVIAVSKFARRYCIDELGISESKISLIYHGRDESFLPERMPSDGQHLERLGIDKPYIFTCGSILPYRKCERVIESFTKTVNRDEICLVIAGSGTDRYYSSLLEKLIEEHEGIDIRWLGGVPIDTMKVLYRNAGLFITATEIEACPNIAIEAMASGCNVIASESPPLPELFDDCALYFERGSSAESIAALIDSAWNSGGSMRDRALNRAKYFDWVKCSNQTYNALIN